MEENYIFTQTASGDRTNIMCNFPIWNKEMFIDNVKNGNGSGRYRYSQIGGYMDLLKGMSLEEFEQIFHPEEFTPEEITSLFRKEISLKYGEHVEKVKIKPISKKELERGCVYEDFSGSKWVYYGEVEQTVDYTYLRRYQSDKRPPLVEKGFGFDSYWKSNEDYVGNTGIHVLKSPKRLMKKVEGLKFELESEYLYETGEKYYRGAEHRTTLKLL